MMRYSVPSTQLQFNLDVPAAEENLATRFSSPSPIVIERILQRSAHPNHDNKQSAVRFSALSANKLSKAMQLAKRDLKLARRSKESRNPRRQESEISLIGNNGRNDSMYLLSTQTQTSMSRQKHELDRFPKKAKGKVESKPPRQSKETKDIHRLCHELQLHISLLKQRLSVGELSEREKLLFLENDEKERLALRHLEQMRKTSRTVYTLQQQVHNVKSALDQASENDSPRKKNAAVNRLCAAYRGTDRLLQTYCSQLPQHLILTTNFVAVSALFQEISKLIRELLLCALEMDFVDTNFIQNIFTELNAMKLDIDQKHPNKLPSHSPISSATNSPNKISKTPSRSFRSKNPVFIKKEPLPGKKILVQPGRNPMRGSRHQQNRSPDKFSVGVRAKSLSESQFQGPLKKSMLEKSSSPRNVKFCSTPDQPNVRISKNIYPQQAEIIKLKEELANEMNVQISSQIKPLVEKVDKLELASSKLSQTKGKNPPVSIKDLVEHETKELVKETMEEMQRFQMEKNHEESVKILHKPSIESLIGRLEAIDREESAIRQRWQQINYEDMQPEAPIITKRTYGVPENPAALNFTKSSLPRASDTSAKEIVKFTREQVPDNLANYECGLTSRRRNAKTKEHMPFTGCVLHLPPSTIQAVERNRRDYERFLKHTFHEAKGKFNPWDIAERCADDIFSEIISTVSNELNEVCEQYASQIFQSEFAVGPQNSDSSLLVSPESSLFSTNLTSSLH